MMFSSEYLNVPLLIDAIKHVVSSLLKQTLS